MLNLKALSKINLEKFQDLIKSVIEHMELADDEYDRFFRPNERPYYLIISKESFRKKGLSDSEVLGILYKIEKEGSDLLQLVPHSDAPELYFPINIEKMSKDNWFIATKNKKDLTKFLLSITKLLKDTPPRLKNIKYYTKKNLCYLRISDKDVKIGKTNTRKCKLLESLSVYVGVAKSIDVVFGDIQLVKDRGNTLLWNGYLSKENRKIIITNTIKEIQRRLAQEGLAGKLKFHRANNLIWIDIC